MNNPNYRGIDPDDNHYHEYREEESERRYNAQQRIRQAENDSKHVLDPEREWPEETVVE